MIAAAIRARERRIAQRLRPGLWAKLLEGRGAVWLAGGPRARARGGVGPRAAGVRAEWSRGVGREVEVRKVDADEGGRGVSDGGGERCAH